MNPSFGSATELAKYFIRQAIGPGDFVIDGTMGNGKDTLFLAKMVSNQGKVFSFDVQEQAIITTKEKLMGEGLDNRVELFHCGHENIGSMIKHKIKGAMFNLGYLPKGDHSITTKGNTTIIALKQVLELLLPQGIVSMCIYYGHPEGKKEKDMVLSFIKSLDYNQYHVIKMDFYNKVNNPPLLVVIEKR